MTVTTLTNEETGQVTEVRTDIDGTTLIEVFNVDEDGNDYLAGSKDFDYTPSSMSDLDIMCQEVDGFDAVA